MDHAYVEEHGLIERYHRGRLPPEDEASFEEHFAGCPQCLEQLVLERGLQRGMKQVAAEEAARSVAAARLGILARRVLSPLTPPEGTVARRGQLARAGLLLALTLIAAGLPTAFFLTRPVPSGGFERPRADLPVVLLRGFRGASGEDVPTLDAARVEDGVVLAAPVDDGFASYRVRVSDASGELLFQETGLRPNAFAALLVVFPAGFFAPGDYRLAIEGLGDDGSAVTISGYPFRVGGRSDS